MRDVNDREVSVGDEILLGEEWLPIIRLESIKMSRVGGEPQMTDVAVTSGKTLTAWTLASRQTRKGER